MTGPAKRTTGQHHGHLRRVLEDAALQLVAERGPRGFSLAEVTRRAGVSVAAPYKHFADRDALLAALAERGYVQQRVAFEAAIGGAAEPSDQMAAFAEGYVRFAFEQRALFEITFRSGLDKAAYPSLAAAGDRVLQILEGPARALRPDDPSAVELIYAVAALAHGLTTFLLEGVFAHDDDALLRTIDRARLGALQLAGP